MLVGIHQNLLEDTMKKIQLYIVLSLLFTAQIAFGSAKSWELDRAHSNVYFSIDHIFSTVNGSFNDFNTEVNFDPKNLSESRFYFEIEVKSINTNVTKRDKHLQSTDFFDASKHPQITFESVKITDGGDGKYDVAGKINVKGVSYDLTLPLVLVGVKDHPAAKGKVVAGFNGRVTLDRLQYNIGGGKFYEMGVAGKDVEVFLSLEFLSSK
jgi:polyisoprenoid-binding protein YceI